MESCVSKPLIGLSPFSQTFERERRRCVRSRGRRTVADSTNKTTEDRTYCNVWTMLNELGAALAPVLEQKRVPRWARRLEAALTAAEDPVTELALKEQGVDV